MGLCGCARVDVSVCCICELSDYLTHEKEEAGEELKLKERDVDFSKKKVVQTIKTFLERKSKLVPGLARGGFFGSFFLSVVSCDHPPSQCDFRCTLIAKMMLGKKAKRICVQCGTATAKKDRVRCKNCGCKIFGTVETSGNSPASSAASTPSGSPRQSKLSPLAMKLRSPRNSSVPSSPVYTPTRKEMKNAKMVCAMCGRPTVKTDRKQCKTCGGTSFEPAPRTLSKEEKFGKSPSSRADVGGDMDPVAAVEAAAADEEFLLATKFAATGVRPKEMPRKRKPVKKENVQKAANQKKTGAAGPESRLMNAQETSPSLKTQPSSLVVSLDQNSPESVAKKSTGALLPQSVDENAQEVAPGSGVDAQDAPIATDSENVVPDGKSSSPQCRQEDGDATVPRESDTEESKTEAVGITPTKAIRGDGSHEEEIAVPPPEKRSTTPDLPNHVVQDAEEKQSSHNAAQQESASSEMTTSMGAPEPESTRASAGDLRPHSHESTLEAGSKNSGEVGRRPESMPKGPNDPVVEPATRGTTPNGTEENNVTAPVVEEGSSTSSDHILATEPETRATVDAHHQSDTVQEAPTQNDEASGQVANVKKNEEGENPTPDDESSDDLADLDEVEANRSTAPSEARRRRLSSTKTADVKCKCTIS